MNGDEAMSKRDLWNERYAAKELVWSAGPNQLFAQLVEGMAPGTALDFGCGEGRNAIWLAEQGWQATGVDFSEAGIAKAGQIADKRGISVDWQAEDATTYQPPADGFDLVAILYLHTDPAEREKWLPVALGAVKAGGSIIYIGHDPSNIEEGVGGPQNPIYLPAAEELTAAMAGFDIERAEVVQRPVANDPGHGKQLSGVALDTLVIARKTNSH